MPSELRYASDTPDSEDEESRSGADQSQASRAPCCRWSRLLSRLRCTDPPYLTLYDKSADLLSCSAIHEFANDAAALKILRKNFAPDVFAE